MVRSPVLETSFTHSWLPGLSDTDSRPRAWCLVLSASLRHRIVMAPHPSFRYALTVDTRRFGAIASQLAYTATEVMVRTEREQHRAAEE